MKKLLAAALVCFFVFGLPGHGLASPAAAPALTLVSEHALSFSKQPLRIEKTEALPNRSLAVFYFAQGEKRDEESYWLDLFSTSGQRLLSRMFVTRVPDASPHPFAQLLIKSDGFVCEYYPDITTMEVCFSSVYTFEGAALQADQKSTLKYGDAAYAKNLGPFILGRQAHAYDEEPADPFTRLAIQHVPTGQARTTKIWDFRPASLVDAENRLWIVQKNEGGNLELRVFAASDNLTEQAIEIPEPALKAHEFTFVISAISHQGAIRLLIHQFNTEYVLLTYDADSRAITARSALSALPGAAYVSGLLAAGPQLLSVHEYWDEKSQSFSKALSLVDGAAAQLPLQFVGEAFGVFAHGQEEAIYALETDAGRSAWFLRKYLFQTENAQAEEGVDSIPWDGVNGPLLDDFPGFTVTSWTQIAGTNWCFVALKKGDQNLLAGYTKDGGKWTQQFVNKHAFPQGEMRMFINDTSGSEKWSENGVYLEQADQHLRGKALYTGWTNGEYHENQCIFELDNQGVWQLSFYAHAGQSGMMEVTADTLYFLEESKDNAKIRVRVRRDLRSFNLALLPKTPGQARQPDALPPLIPPGFLEAREMGLGAGGVFPVYSAPDKASLRGVGGKAAVSSKGWVQVFGREGAFILVQYAIARGHFRVGYVDAAALSEYWDAPEPLDFTRVQAFALRDTKLTDDPLGQGETLLSLKAGQEVTLLSKMGGFAYLETKQGKKAARGFAPLDAFDQAPAPAVGLRLHSLHTKDGQEEVLLRRAAASGLGLSLWFDSQRLSAYESGDFLMVSPRRLINDDSKSLDIKPAQVALYAYEWQKRTAAGEDMNSTASGMTTADGQPICPSVPPLAELSAQARAFYTWNGWRITEMGTELTEQLPHFPQEATTGFYACKDDLELHILCLETPQGSFVCTIQHPKEAAHTWGARLRYALSTLEMIKQE